MSSPKTLHCGRPQIEEWGLNNSLFQQYGAYISRAFTGDFGVSLTYRPGTPVAEIMASKAAETLTLVLTALFLSLLVGTAMAFWSAGRTRTLSRASLRLLSVPPVFLIAYLSMILLDSWAYSATVEAGEPPPGWFPLLMEDSSLKFWLAVGALALGSSALTEIHGAAEREIRRIRSSGYVDAARARGAPIWPHTLSTLLPALTTLVSSRAAFFLGGAIIVEKVFGLHGLGDALGSLPKEGLSPRAGDYALVGRIRLRRSTSRRLAPNGHGPSSSDRKMMRLRTLSTLVLLGLLACWAFSLLWQLRRCLRRRPLSRQCSPVQ